jgi:multiple sugar transport system ATP-binding protein
VAPGKPVSYGVRPEHLTLSSDGVPARVVVVEPTGSETQVVVEIDGHLMTCLLRERISIHRGESVHIRPNPAQGHLFDGETGQRLSAHPHPASPASGRGEN